MQNRFKLPARLLSVLLAVCLLGSCAAPESASAQGGEARSARLHTLFAAAQGWHEDVHFPDLVYERPDIDAIDALIDQGLSLVQVEEIEEALVLYNEIDTAIGHYTTMMALASIYSDLDVTDAFYAAEVQLLQENYTRFNNRLNELIDALLASSGADTVRDYWGEEFIEQYEWYSQLNDPSIEPLMAQEQALINEYRAACAEETSVEHDGVRVTLNDLDLTQPEDVLLYYEIYRKRNEALGGIFCELAAVRSEIGHTMGYDNYADYAYALQGADYTTQEAAAFCETVLEWFEPVDIMLDEIYTEEIMRAEAQAQISPTDALPLLEKALTTGGYPSAMANALRYMQDNALYDFGGGPNRMPTAYTTLLNDYTAPFLFINTDTFPGADTLFHEFGHFYNYYCSANPDWYDADSLDLAEVHSQGLELLMMDAYDEIYGADAEGMACGVFQNLVGSVLQGCMEDEFQQAVYANPSMTLDEMNALHAELSQKYIGYPLMYEWVEINHNYEAPCYYISYATSAVSALELWTVAQEDRTEALRIYNDLTRHNFNAGYRETLTTVGLSDPFTSDCVPRVAAALDDALGLGALGQDMAA